MSKTTVHSWLLMFIATLLLFTSGLRAASAADIFVNFGENGLCAGVFYGEIDDDDDEFFDVLTSNCTNGGFVLESPGGVLQSGLNIGRMIRRRGLETVVPWDKVCASACALAWLGGNKRYLADASLVGFHAAYRKDGDKAVESGVANALVGSYLSKLGLSDEAIVFLTIASPDSVNMLDVRWAKTLNIPIVALTDDDREWVQKVKDNAAH